MTTTEDASLARVCVGERDARSDSQAEMEAQARLSAIIALFGDLVLTSLPLTIRLWQACLLCLSISSANLRFRLDVKAYYSLRVAKMF